MAEKVLLLMNLGSPESTDLSDVKSYLDEFLMDERVIDLPYALRWLLVKGIITRIRPYKTAQKYKEIWTDKGSPLVSNTKDLVSKVQDLSGINTYWCMRYGLPSPELILEKIVKENPDVKELILFPLYPHYALSSYETAVEHVRKYYAQYADQFQLKVVKPFYNNESYVGALAASIEPYLKKPFDYVLFSYHGIPERHVRKTDPTKSHCLTMEDCCNQESPAHEYCYRHQVFKTTELVTKKLGLNKSQYSVSFQSRLGLDKWLTPNSVDLFEDLPKKGIKKLLVVCPAFVSDCLETLEEIEQEGKELFLNAQGKEFQLIPCLNSGEDWVKSLVKIGIS